ncbi:MAG: flagellar basal body P-ring protein FlgI [Planctomycetota bacterium]|jgi:flagellar basal body P-ring protein FlgI
MENYQKKTVCVISILIICSFITGCEQPVQVEEAPTKIDSDTTIGSLTEMFSVEPIPVRGYALVCALRGTGSPQCPPEIRAYLERYILRNLPSADVEQLINSNNTAVVSITGFIPALALKNARFDVKVTALAGTQTKSLEGGELWGADLTETRMLVGSSKVSATAEGSVFTDKITEGSVKSDKKTGYILGGGRVKNNYVLSLVLRRPDYKVSSIIRNLLNERFGEETAKAISQNLIEVKVPAKYRKQKERFISIVKAMYLVETPEITNQRISNFIRKLAASEEKDESEIALEAIGNECLDKLAVLLNSRNEQVRLRAGRCILNLGGDAGLNSLREIAMDKVSPYRIEALEVITTSASRNDASKISRRLLRDEDFDIRLASYENLRKLDDIAIIESFIGRSFYLEQITQTDYKAIFVSRSGQPRIALFGTPLRCRDDVFIQSDDGEITINARVGEKEVSIIRKHPWRPNVTIPPLKSSFEVSDIIRTLCESSVVEDTSKLKPGLNVTYDDAISILKKMCEKGAIGAQFRAGPLPKID